MANAAIALYTDLDPNISYFVCGITFQAGRLDTFAREISDSHNLAANKNARLSVLH